MRTQDSTHAQKVKIQLDSRLSKTPQKRLPTSPIVTKAVNRYQWWSSDPPFFFVMGYLLGTLFTVFALAKLIAAGAI